MTGHLNKQQRHLGALSQARRAPLSKNENLEIVDDEHDSSDGVLEIDMNSFRSAIQ